MLDFHALPADPRLPERVLADHRDTRPDHRRLELRRLD